MYFNITVNITKLLKMTIYGGYHLKINSASQYAILKMSIHTCQTSSPLLNDPTLSPCSPDKHAGLSTHSHPKG